MTRGRLARCVSGLGAVIRQTERVFLTVLATSMVAFALLQVVLRNFFQRGWPWADPLLGMGLLWLTMLGALAASGRGRRHISMDALSHILPGRFRGMLGRANAGFAALVCAALAHAAWRFVVMQREFSDELLAGLPKWTLYLVLPLGFGLMALRFAGKLLIPEPRPQAPPVAEAAP